jgi:thiol:disulfide interchange protein DsbC
MMNLKVLALLAAAISAAVPAVASADEASVKRGVESRFSGAKVDSVARTPYLDLYEVVIGDEIIYTDDKVNYIFNGSVLDARTRRNLTEERQQKLSAIKFDELPLAQAIKTVRGNGKRAFVVFADPRCPFCRQFEEGLAKMTDVTIYTLLYPVIAPDSAEISRNIWCAKDPSRAWLDMMLKGILPAPKNCDTPLEKNLALGKRLRVSGTPTTFLPDGQRVVGARLAEVVRALDAGAK